MVELRTVRDFLKWEPYLNESMQSSLREIACPLRMGSADVPQDLNGITLGQLTTLQTASDSRTFFEAFSNILLKMTPKEAMKAKVVPMMGIANMVMKELERITQLFQSISPEPTAIEIQAGSEKLNFGIFGLADWYARRMGMTDQDEAFDTGWVRVWQCLKNDTTEMQYRKRLAELQAAQMNAKYKTR